jgi:diacylglycerol kinase (ATP)
MSVMSMPVRYPLILNPRAKSERARKALRFVMDHATRFAIYATNSPEEARDLAGAFADAGEKVVVAAGGDGSLNAVVSGLAGSETILGILPTGTMNVFAREMGIPFDQLRRALEVIDEGNVEEVDLFEVNGSPFVQMAGVGFDAKVISETTREAKKALGPLAYLVSAVKVLGDEPPRMKVRFEEGVEADGVCVLVGNGSLYGGQVRLFRKASNADDLLDVLVFKEAGYKFVRDSLAGLARGGFREDSGSIEYYQSSGLTVECDREVPVEVDGDYWGAGRRLEFAHSARKLRVLAPSERGKNWWEEVLRTLTPWAE